MDKDTLISAIDAAKMLGVCVNTLSIWRSTGRYNLPFVRIGRLVKYKLSDINEFIKMRTNK